MSCDAEDSIAQSFDYNAVAVRAYVTLRKMKQFSAVLFLALAAWGEAPTAAFVSADYVVPKEWKTSRYKLAPLSPAIVREDYEAYMSSIEHLRQTFSDGKWPSPGITMEEAMKDMQNEESRFVARKSFAYGVLTLDGKKELGSVYVRPSRKQGYDAVVTMWVTKEMFDRGFETQLYQDVKKWVATAWPFHKVAYPGKEISKADWAKLPDKK